MCRHEVALGLEGYDISLTQVVGIHNIDNCVVLGKCWGSVRKGGLQWLQELLGSSVAPLGLAPRDQGRQR